MIGPAIADHPEMPYLQIRPFGHWPWLLSDSPLTICVPWQGRWQLFRRAVWEWPRSGIALQYRQASCPSSGHLYVSQQGVWWVDHLDRANPDPPCGMVLRHLLLDVLS